MNKFIPIAILLSLTACSQPDKAQQVLSKAGYTDIQTGGYGMFSCSDDDTFKTKFTAKGPSGQTVEGVVCSGLFKGSTIRID
jgi:hypothetical protein